MPRLQSRCVASLPPLHAAFAPPRSLRCVTLDVTGTILSFQGKLGEWYALAAARSGLSLSCGPKEIEKAFKLAYKELCASSPCFGGDEMTTRSWWRLVVLRSFELAGERLSAAEQERVFQRVYSLFGSHSTYKAFDDAKPFLKWCHRRGLVTGVISNADERYMDDILPLLNLDVHIDFFECSKRTLCEKPDPRMFGAALSQANEVAKMQGDYSPIKACEVLHIGDSLEKDFGGAVAAGWNAVLLDRFGQPEWTRRSRAAGAAAFTDLVEVVEFLGRAQVALPAGELSGVSYNV